MLTKQWLQRTLFILLIGAVSSQWGGNANRKKETCNKPSLKNGKIKWRSNGRVVKYSCNKDYILVGESTSTCLQGEWTSDTPVCAARGCPVLLNPTSGRFVPSYGGAVLRLECNPGYYPSDSPMLYCDRFEWNSTSPSCQPSGVAPSFSCDFEQDDLCGWSQDASDEFDWTWQSYTTPSYHLGTGPSFDHTLGANKGGHYLFIESSSPRSLNDTARLYSPVYGPPSSGGDVNSTSNEQCFTFWYHMYGSDSGRLHVYVKAESVVKLSQVNPTFVRIGDQGNLWRQGYLPLPANLTIENFQVVIEGVRGTGYVGDTAIDDVQVVSGADCLAAKERMLAEKSGPSTAGGNRPSTLPPKMSCFSRCSATTAASSNADLCGCRDDCLLTNSCCSDYATFCLTESTTIQSTTMMTTSSIPIATTPTTMSTTVKAPTAVTTTIPPSTTKMTTPLSLSTTTTPVLSTTTTSTSTSTLPPTTTTKITTITSAPTTTTKITTIPSAPTTTTTTTTTTVLPSTSSTPSSTTASPSSATTVPVTVPSDFASDYFSSRQPPPPPTPTRDGVQGDESAVPGASRITDDGTSQSSRNRDRQQQPGGILGAIAGGVGGCILLISAVALIGVYVRRRRFLHRIGGGGQQQQQDLLAEDSDVRYLKDEDDIQLDLTEATPSSTRQFSNFERL